MKIKLNKKILIDNFLTPISKISDRCVVSIFPNHVYSVVTTNEGNPILYAKVDIVCDMKEDECTLNLPNVTKLTRMLSCIDSDDIELVVNSNNIEYDSLNMRFKYHLLEEGVIEKVLLTTDKIKGLTFDTDFIITRDKIVDIIKGTMFANETNKIYFHMKDSNIYTELTDRVLSNTDSVNYFITNKFNGAQLVKPIPLSLDIVKLFFGIKEDVSVKVNSKTNIMMFMFSGSNYILKYITTPLKK